MNYIPRDNCQKCGKTAEAKGALRRMAEIGKKDECVTMFFFCSCGNTWTCGYLASALGPGWEVISSGKNRTGTDS